MNFLISSYLWLLPIVLTPIIIYLFNRRKFKNIHFSSIKFLNMLNKKKIKKINIINIILILIRTLIVLFFILMMSRPTYKGSNNFSDTNSSILYIVIDNSFSMYNQLENSIKQKISNIQFKLVHLKNIKELNQECIC